MEDADSGQPKRQEEKDWKEKWKTVVVPEKFKYLEFLHLWGKKTDFSG